MRSFFYLALMLPSIAVAQQLPMYSQYMFNGLTINPAYAGTSDALNVSSQMRWQWTGLEGAPRTTTVSAHAPVQRKKIGLGFVVSRDEIAVFRQTSVFGMYAYRLQVGTGYLSMGLQGGFTAFRADYSKVYTLNPDATFQDTYSQFMPNAGAGVFYYNSLFYAGLSAPLLVANQVANGDAEVFTQRRHYFFSSGAVFKLSDRVKVKPNILVKMVDGSPLSVDYNINFLLNDIVWVGASVRPPESVCFLTEVNLNKRFRIGYSYDYITQPMLRSATTASHEVLLNYKISLVKNGVVTPRYF